MVSTLKGRGYIDDKVEATGGGKVKAKNQKLQVLDIGYWCFEFVWDLMLVICDLLNMQPRGFNLVDQVTNVATGF